MKILYEIDETLAEDTIVIKANKITDELMKIKLLLENSKPNTIIGYQDKLTFPISSSMVERIYTANRKTYIVANNELYEAKKNLMFFEHISKYFVRVSKSCIVNTKHLKSIEAEFSGNFVLHFKSGNKESLSRSYVKKFKIAIGMEN